jgi:hypothetical protein
VKRQNLLTRVAPALARNPRELAPQRRRGRQKKRAKGISAGLPPVLQRASVAVARHTRRCALLALGALAKELGVHIRTLQAAARTGRLETEFGVPSVFGRPRRRASRAAGEAFLSMHYRCFSGQAICPMPLPVVPTDYDEQLRVLRQQLRLTQGALARRIGAAGKAVVYQWESRKRTPSPVLWQRVLELDRRPARAARAWDDRAYHGNRFRHLDSRVIQSAETSE